MEEVDLLKQDKATKQRCAHHFSATQSLIFIRKTIYYISQGRAIRRMVALYSPIEDLIAENDRRCENDDEYSDFTPEQNRLQRGYIEFVKILPWVHEKLSSLDHEESEDMLRKLRRGADSARGDDTGTLKELVASWVNIECNPTPLIRTDDKHHRGFVSDACGKLLCPAEWRWGDPVIRAGIRDRTTSFIVSENSWPMFMYENYQADANNLERGLFKSKLLVMGFKAIFTSPSSANEADGDGDGANIIENNRRARRRSDQVKVKTCIRFALSNVSSWRAVDGDFDYQIFWDNIVDFFEDAPGPAARARVKELLEWWTRKVFGKNHREDLTMDVVSRMSISALAVQRQEMENAVFDSE
ncbi:uncharacterized protein F5147DRAFT_584102 [Suillus discolor]|uniref:Uncharacterized protein n=1 Tax=Suillus discolor TaxID=1912936 RepID=A0A9P7JPP5_9AGAM|nr:uncharacterized protein F5147DRAFT_584102 [Suillus discolor]KAG2096362.1 hypothetical protein F5147DRAFT_584102 [Suillus discolor]